MINHIDITDQGLRELIRKKKISFGGNAKLKIYGYLQCKSGRRMSRENRVFFIDEHEAITQGFRPCGNCMKIAYKKWKNGLI
jgi:methylphosphotriester-DNA--protein-cysteine methyltransferase